MNSSAIISSPTVVLIIITAEVIIAASIIEESVFMIEVLYSAAVVVFVSFLFMIKHSVLLAVGLGAAIDKFANEVIHGWKGLLPNFTLSMVEFFIIALTVLNIWLPFHIIIHVICMHVLNS